MRTINYKTDRRMLDHLPHLNYTMNNKIELVKLITQNVIYNADLHRLTKFCIYS